MSKREIISAALERIVKHHQPEKVILFGSYAYGTPTEDSDIDFCVITEHNTSRRWLQAEICLLLADLNAGFDIIAVKPEELPTNPSPNNTFYDILNKGTLLYDRLRN